MQWEKVDFQNHRNDLAQYQLSGKGKEIQALKEQMAKMEDEAKLKVRSLEDDVKSIREDMKNMFEVLRKAC